MTNIFVLGILIPINDNSSSSTTLGALYGLKTLLPIYYNYLKEGNDTIITLNQILQIFELCLHYLKAENTVIQNGALEALYAFLHNAPKDFINILISDNYDVRLIKEDAQEVLDSCNDLTEYVQVTNTDFDKAAEVVQSVSDADIYIGDLSKKDTNAIMFCARTLTHKFLLTGFKGTLKDDVSVKVTLKYLSICCLCDIVKFYPKCMTSFIDDKLDIKFDHFGAPDVMEFNADRQSFADLLLYAQHSDPQLRGATCILIASFIRIIDNDFFIGYDAWCDSLYITFKDVYSLANLSRILIQGLKDKDHMACKQSLQAIDICLNSLITSCSNFEVMRLLLHELIQIHKTNTYWLIKVKLCELLSKLNYKYIYIITNTQAYQTKVLNDVLYTFLSDDDVRVRNASKACLVNIIPKLYYPFNYTNTDTLVNVFTKAYDKFDNYQQNSIKYVVDNKLCKNLMWPFCETNKYNYIDDQHIVDDNLSRIINDLKSLCYLAMDDKSLKVIFVCI